MKPRGFNEDVGSLLIGRVFPASLFLMVVIVKLRLLVLLIAEEESRLGLPSLRFYCDVAHKISVILFFGMMTVLFIVRLAPVKKSQGILPRVSALIGSFIMSLVAALPQGEPPLVQTLAATVVLLMGMGFTLFTLSVLGRSFSMMPEARRLVTKGPYAFVRHPMYLGEIIANIGLVLQVLSIYSLMIFVVFLWLQIKRMKYEEEVLHQVFPAYEEYKQKTSRLIPGLY